MDMDKLMGTLRTMLAEMQEKADANTKTMREEMKADRGQMLASINAEREERKANQAKADAHQAEIKSGQVEMRTIIKAWSSDLKADRENGEETMACQDGGTS
jgi:hypothetical protein